MDKQNEELFDCQRMFRHACAFAECADMAMGKSRGDNVSLEWFVEPAIVNSAFACEVFLKALLLFYECPLKRQHKLKELYELLPCKPKEYIKQTTMLRYGGVWEDAFGFEILDSFSNAFVDWRYSYEAIHTLKLDIGFLTAFRNTLCETCCQVLFSKTWEEYSAN